MSPQTTPAVVVTPHFAAVRHTKQKCARFARRKSEDVYLVHVALEEEVLFDNLLVTSSNDAATIQIESSQFADSPSAAMSFAKILLRLTGLPQSE